MSARQSTCPVWDWTPSRRPTPSSGSVRWPRCARWSCTKDWQPTRTVLCANPCATLSACSCCNLATVGGSLYSRFGFSDVLTMFLVLDAQVELYKGGIVPLSEYAERPKDRDILVRVIVPKRKAKFNYQSVRISQTDIPVLTCASVKDENGYRFAIGARPARAQIYAQPVDKTAEQMAEVVRAEIKTGSSLRGSAEYRRHLAGVLVRRAAHALDAE